MSESVKLLSKLISSLSPEKKALLLGMLNGPEEPIAITGMGCRFPGRSDSPDAYWQMLKEGVDAIGKAPTDRWNGENSSGAQDDMNVRMAVRWGGFIEQVDGFDAAFFGIAPREAIYMDPQQRLLLEVAWEALENAGQAVDSLAGSQTGVFVGVCSSDYLHFHLRSEADDGLDPYSTSGTAHSIVANRLSYLLDLRGPSVAVDTACSSSLVAVHLACQSIRNRECRMALAGGVNLMLAPETSLAFSRLGMLAPDGRCKTFDAQADGYARGEGCGVVVLKRLSDALADGDPVLALIRGSAINQDGRSNGLTAPNVQAQEAVIRQALRNAGVTPDQIGYVETHGTGTALGDPIEIEALATALSPVNQHRAGDTKCVLGAVKTNIGHLEAAAGVASLIKTVLSLRHEEIPPHLHFHTLNPNISLAHTPFVIPTAAYPWPAGDRPHVAGVSAFGFGGTNAHVVLEEAPRAIAKHRIDGKHAGEELPLYILPVSARTPEALPSLVRAYNQLLSAKTGDTGDIRDNANSTNILSNLCYSASVRRSHHRYRLAFLAHSKEEMIRKLATWLDNSMHDTTSVSAVTTNSVYSEDAALKVLADGGYENFIAHSSRREQLSAALPRERSLQIALLEALATLYTHGYTINWSFVYPNGGQYVSLPSYPWQRKRFWVEASSAARAGANVGSIAHVSQAHISPTMPKTSLPEPEDWIYQLRWQPKELDPYLPARGYRAKAQPGNWLILADASGVGQALARRLQALDERCVLVYPGQSFAWLGPRLYQVDATAPEDFQRLLKETWDEQHPYSMIVHCWNLDIEPPEVSLHPSTAADENASLSSCESVLHLLHALLGERRSPSPRVWLVTRGAQPVEAATALAMMQSPVWGMGRTISLEYPGTWGGLIDLDPRVSSEKSAAQLMEVLYGPDGNGAGDGEDQLAFRGGFSYVLRLLPWQSDTTDVRPMPVRSDGTYLITGGLGAIGLKAAAWLAEHGARHLVLLGRTGLPQCADTADIERLSPEARKRVEVVRALQSSGVQVRVVEADVSDFEQMRRVFADIADSSYPLRGILHAAGISISQTIATLDVPTLQTVLRPKVQGSWVLHQLSQQTDIDFFVLFSSASAVWGSPQLAAYTSANLFLDALAHTRRAQGLPALSINWGLWGDSGMVSQKIEQVIRKAGVLPMQGQPALNALAYLLGTDAVQAVIAEVDWQTFIPTFETGGKHPVFSSIGAGFAQTAASTPEQQSELASRLERATYQERLVLLEQHIQAEVNQVMGFDQPFMVDPEQSLFDLGMDSLMALKLENRLERSLGRAFPATVPFDHPTVAALARCLNDLF